MILSFFATDNHDYGEYNIAKKFINVDRFNSIKLEASIYNLLLVVRCQFLKVLNIKSIPPMHSGTFREDSSCDVTFS